MSTSTSPSLTPGTDTVFIPSVATMAQLQSSVTSLASSVKLIKSDGTVNSITVLSNTDSERGAAFQTAIADHVSGDKIVLGGGVHLASTPSELAPNVELRGNGLTTLKLADQGSTSFSGAKAVIFGVSAARTDQVKIKDILFDCNLAGQSAANACVGAVLIYGGNYSLIERCRAIGWGTKSSSLENFLFVISHYSDLGKSFGCKIKDCFAGVSANVVNASGGVTAFSIAGDSASPNTVDNGWMRNVSIEGCGASDIIIGTTSGRTYDFKMLGLGNVSGGALIGNYANDFTNEGGAGQMAGFYHDTGGSCHFVTVAGNRFINCNASGSFTAILIGTISGQVLSDWMFVDNMFNVYDAFTIQPVAAGGVANWMVQNNKIRKVGSGTRNGFYLSNTTNFLVRNNVMDTDTAFTNVSGNTAFNHSGNVTSAGVSVDS